MKVNYYQYDLKFRHPFTISKGTKTHQPTFIIELEHFGWKGYGEAPAISYYNIPVEKMIEDLEAKKPSGHGVPAKDFQHVLGKHLNKKKSAWDFLEPGDIE